MIRLMFSFWMLMLPFFLSGYKSEVAIAAIFQDEAPFLKEWIDYHRHIGVEHFWLYNDISSDGWEEVLQPYVDEGVVEVIDWSECRQRIQKWPQIQIEAYKDAMTRALGVSKWVALIDTDEFIVPMKNKTIQSCLKKYFSKEKAVYMQWLVFGTSGVELAENESMLTRLTYCSEWKHPWNNVGKTIVQPESVLIEKIWYPHHVPLKPSLDYVSGSRERIPMEDYDLHMTSHQGRYIRINHYFFRDEKFFHEVKIPRKLKGNMPLEELFHLYDACSKAQDYKIMNLLK